MGRQMTQTLGPDDVGNDSYHANPREHCPVFWREQLHRWILIRYDDVRTGYRKPGVFSSQTFAQRRKGQPRHWHTTQGH